VLTLPPTASNEQLGSGKMEWGGPGVSCRPRTDIPGLRSRPTTQWSFAAPAVVTRVQQLAYTASDVTLMEVVPGVVAGDSPPTGQNPDQAGTSGRAMGGADSGRVFRLGTQQVERHPAGLLECRQTEGRGDLV